MRATINDNGPEWRNIIAKTAAIPSPQAVTIRRKIAVSTMVLFSGVLENNASKLFA